MLFQIFRNLSVWQESSDDIYLDVLVCIDINMSDI